MLKHTAPKDRGQTLVIVALALIVLLLFVALAVDVGFWYAQRRSMQNAADAGALAGARVRCFDTAPTFTKIEAQAISYSVANGGAGTGVNVLLMDHDGFINPGGNVVVVTATTRVTPFFGPIMQIAGIGAGGGLDIAATAAAACGPMISGCGMWPVAFDLEAYEDFVGECNGPTYEEGYDPEYVADNTNFLPEAVNPESQFILWADDNVSWDPPKVQEHCKPFHPELYNISYAIGGTPMLPGNRGWVDLALANPYKPPKDSEYSACSGNLSDCGAASLNCWLRYGFIGSLAIGECVKGEPGVKSSSITAAKAKEKQAVSVLIFGPESCPDPNNIAANCSTSGSKNSYYITDFGCVRVEKVYDSPQEKITFLHKKGFGEPIPEDEWPDDWCVPLGGTAPCPESYSNDWCVAGGGTAPCPKYTYDTKYGCTEKNGKWSCTSSEAEGYTCPSGLGIIVTKLCSCPPTQCVGTDGVMKPNTRVTAVSLIAVPGN